MFGCLVALFYSLVGIIVEGRPNCFVHQVVPSPLLYHAAVEFFNLMLAVTAALPERRKVHFNQAAVIYSAAHVFANKHRHVVNAIAIRCSIGTPVIALLQALNVEGLRVLSCSDAFCVLVSYFKKFVLLVRGL